MALVANLKDMGFTDDQIQAGLKATGSKEMETVVNWIVTNPEAASAPQNSGEPATSQPSGHVLGSSASNDTTTGQSGMAVGDSGGSGGVPNDAPEVAMSLKCEDCGKLLRNTIEAEAHAAKSGHSNFSESTEEIKPLTEEEKKAQLELLNEKMKQRRKEREERERLEALEKEKNRRKEGQSLSSIKDEFERKEMMKAAEERRKEKEADRLAREKVKADIARDRANKKQALENESQSAAAAAQLSQQTSATVAPKKPTDYTETRIQIRFKGSPPKVQKFKPQEPLSAVRLFVQLNSPIPLSETFTLMTTFPKKIFTQDDMQRPLFDLGLVPSAVLDIHS